MSLPAAVYHPRNPQLSDYYRCVEDYFETFVGIYDEHFTRQNDFWRPYLEEVICRYLDCGDLQNGFTYVKCKDCGHEYLLAFFCKCCCFQLVIFNAFLASILSSCESECQMNILGSVVYNSLKDSDFVSILCSAVGRVLDCENLFLFLFVTLLRKPKRAANLWL